MQTFVPYEDPAQCAEVLDDKRLNKQITECRQIIQALESDGTAWRNHVAVRMWEGYVSTLKIYYNFMLKEWKENRGRNYKHGLYTDFESGELIKRPVWWGRNDIHHSHKARLFFKDPVFYEQFSSFALVYPEYVWPVPKISKDKTVWVSVEYKNVVYKFKNNPKVKIHPAFKILS